MVVLPDGMDPVAKWRFAIGQNIEEALTARSWSRKQLILEVANVYGIEISEASLSTWIKGEVAPRPDVQAALAGVFGIPHHLLFPPVQLERRRVA